MISKNEAGLRCGGGRRLGQHCAMRRSTGQARQALALARAGVRLTTTTDCGGQKVFLRAGAKPGLHVLHNRQRKPIELEITFEAFR